MALDFVRLAPVLVRKRFEHIIIRYDCKFEVFAGNAFLLYRANLASPISRQAVSNVLHILDGYSDKKAICLIPFILGIWDSDTGVLFLPLHWIKICTKLFAQLPSPLHGSLLK